MTSYHGGKQRKGPVIAQMIINNIESTKCTHKTYIEPFCGMLGVFYTVYSNPKAPFSTFIASDISASVIKMWNELLKGWIPPSTITREEFKALKYNGESSALKGYVGHQFSFGGSYFSSFQKTSSQQNNVNKITSMANAMRQTTVPVFKCHDYLYYTLENTRNSVIYCDPPYESTVCYYYNDQRKRPKYESKTFWKWAIQMAEQNTIFVSEFSVPSEFTPYFTKLDTFATKTNYYNNNQNTSLLYHDNLFVCNIKENLIVI